MWSGEKMSYGAPWEQGVGVSDTTPLLDLEALGLVPNTDGNGLSARQARQHRYQRGRQQRRRVEKSQGVLPGGPGSRLRSDCGEGGLEPSGAWRDLARA